MLNQLYLPMNKKTFTLSLVFLIATIVWLAVNIYWDLHNYFSGWSTVWAVLFVIFAFLMVVNECKKKKRRHLEDADPHQIP